MPLERVNLARGHGAAAGTSSTTPAGADKFTATPEEVRVIEEKMKDPVFVELLHDYMKSLEDPETRREEEAYLEQAEREAREGGDFSFEFVFPRPAYVVELLEPSNTRITAAEAKQLGMADAAAAPRDPKMAARSYLNVCQSDKVKLYTEHATSDANGSNWEVPVSVSARRVEAYNPVASSPSTHIPAEYAAAASCQPCIIHDVVFHPSTLALGERSNKFMAFLVEIAVEHLNGGYGESNGVKFQRLPGSIASIGTPQNQTLRTKQSATTPATAGAPDTKLQKAAKQLATPKDEEKRKRATSPPLTTHQQPQKRAEAPSTAPALSGSAVTPSPPPPPTAAEAAAPSQLPPYTITHRGSIDLTDAWRWSVSDKRIGVPNELIVKLTFAEVRRAAALDITIVPDGHALRIDRTADQRVYEGLLVLPFTVEEVPTQAQFDRTRGVLTLTLKVVAPPLPEGVPTAEELRKSLPGGVGGTDAEVVETEKEEEEEPAAPCEQQGGPMEDTTTTTATANAEAPIAEAVEAVRPERDTAPVPDEPTTAAPAQEASAAVASKPEVAHIGNQDRVAAMLAQVEAARAARAAATAEAHTDPTASTSSPPPSPVQPQRQEEDTERKPAAAAAAAAATPAAAASTLAAVAEEDIPFIRKTAPPPAATDDEDAVRARQRAWAAMMEAEMQAATAREEAEAAEAARAADVQAAKARKRLAAEKERERLEQLAQAKRDAMPLSNKYIFAID